MIFECNHCRYAWAECGNYVDNIFPTKKTACPHCTHDLYDFRGVYMQWFETAGAYLVYRVQYPQGEIYEVSQG